MLFVTTVVTAVELLPGEVDSNITRSDFMYARISAWTLALALVLTAHATAQERFGTLQGRVTDQQSAPIPASP